MKRGKKKHQPGPKPSITLPVVKRVSKRFGMGVPLREALAAEGRPTINEETWKKALAAHPELSPQYTAAKGKFLAEAMQRLAAHKDAKFLCWMLERRYPEEFAKRTPDVAVSVSNNVSLAIPEDVIERAREIASEHPTASNQPPEKAQGPNAK